MYPAAVSGPLLGTPLPGDILPLRPPVVSTGNRDSAQGRVGRPERRLAEENQRAGLGAESSVSPSRWITAALCARSKSLLSPATGVKRNADSLGATRVRVGRGKHAPRSPYQAAPRAWLRTNARSKGWVTRRGTWVSRLTSGDGSRVGPRDGTESDGPTWPRPRPERRVHLSTT